MQHASLKFNDVYVFKIRHSYKPFKEISSSHSLLLAYVRIIWRSKKVAIVTSLFVRPGSRPSLRHPRLQDQSLKRRHRRCWSPSASLSLLPTYDDASMTPPQRCVVNYRLLGHHPRVRRGSGTDWTTMCGMYCPAREPKRLGLDQPGSHCYLWVLV